MTPWWNPHETTEQGHLGKNSYEQTAHDLAGRINALERAYSTLFDMCLERDWKLGVERPQISKHVRRAFWIRRFGWLGIGALIGVVLGHLLGR